MAGRAWVVVTALLLASCTGGGGGDTTTTLVDEPTETTAPSDDAGVTSTTSVTEEEPPSLEPAFSVVALAEGDSYREALCAIDVFALTEEEDPVGALAAQIAALPADSPEAADEIAELTRRLERVEVQDPEAPPSDDLLVVVDILRTRCTG